MKVEQARTKVTGGKEKLPTFHRLYFVLAALDLVTIVLGLVLSHQVAARYEASAVHNRVWADRLGSTAELARLAGAVNAPGNDVFESEDPRTESARTRLAYGIFMTSLAHLQANLGNASAEVGEARAAELKADTAQISRSMEEMIAEADIIFEGFRAKDRATAGAHMALMDRKFSALTGAVDSLSRHMRAIQAEALDEQAHAAATLRKMEYVVGALFLVVVSGVAFYGNRSVLYWRASEQQRQAQEERVRVAEEANRSKSAFLANMSHEIRTPMTAILGYAELLAREGIPEETRREHAGVVQRNAKHLLQMLDDILDLSKVEAGELTVECIPCSPMEVVGDVASLMRVRALEKHIGLAVEYETALPEEVLTDPTRLRQILFNLVANAIKFTQEGEVRILSRYEPDAGTLSFLVRDTGIGVSSDQMGRLFQPFSQADTSMTRRYGGTGLGLALSRRLAQALGGDIAIASEQGNGSTFTVAIAAPPKTGARLVQPSSESNLEPRKQGDLRETGSDQLRGLRVLLVEDGADNQRLFSLLLRSAGAEVTTAGNGLLGVELCMDAMQDQGEWSVVLMDMQMPVLDGYDAARRLRKQGYRGPVIALTAHALAEERKRCLDAGCDGYLSKPVSPGELVDTVERFARGPGGARPPRAKSEVARAEASAIAAIATDFVARLPDTMNKVTRAFEEGAHPDAMRIAHDLKGIGASLGFPEVTESARALEDALKVADLVEARAQLDLLARVAHGIVASREAS